MTSATNLARCQEMARRRVMLDTAGVGLPIIMAFATLGNIIQIARRHWRVDAVQAQQTGAYRGRTVRMVRIGFDGLELTRRKTHAGVGAKTHRVIRRVRSTAQRRVVGQSLFQQLTETVHTGFGDPPLQRLQHTGGFQPGIR